METTMTYLGIHFPTAASRPAGILERFWQSIRKYVQADRRRQELYRLPDRVLTDIGLHRSEIDGIATNLSDFVVDPTRIRRGRRRR
jgi:uncharacterized protein YjiS (DUF1127 family)